MYKTTYHRDHSVTLWDVYRQTWVRTSEPSDRMLATLNETERARVLRHLGQAKTEWLVVRSAFHGGGIVSRHRTEAAAVRSANRHTRNTDCTCGCVGVVSAEELAELDYASESRSPYNLSR